jgi:hypothetical protein
MITEEINMTDRNPPDGYEWPGSDALNVPGAHYWIEPQSSWTGATPLFMVMKAWVGGQTIIAERCYRTYAAEIVDALRAAVREVQP